MRVIRIDLVSPLAALVAASAHTEEMDHLSDYVGPRDRKLRLPDIKELFELMRG